MRVLPTNPVFFDQIQAKAYGVDLAVVKSLDSIKKIAANKELDIFINVSNNKELLQDKLIFLALATKALSTERGAAKLFIDKNVTQNELSVKLYNLVMMAIESFENKIKNIKR